MKFVSSCCLCLFVCSQWTFLTADHGRQRRATTFNINSHIDDVLASINADVASKGLSMLPLDDINESFSKKSWLGSVTGTFTATNGEVRDLSTIKRTGDATVSSTNTAVTLSLHLGLDELSANYDFHLEAKHVSMTGNIGVSVESFSIAAQATLHVDDDEGICTAMLDSATIEYMQGIKVDVSGLGWFDWVGELILGWVENKFNDDIHDKLQDRLQTYLMKKLSSYEVCLALYTM